ncbi:hypothetical protein [Candidatus Nitrospira inopinata]|uniref:Lipoprotein LpqB beta-propeller domain-containing protein n=1 Tax=Candidatus Nitrospira inopinata TaxID=1715989 RepID=A0A0S4KUX4_9BACT|nr:hypothetical protein [Candidatus Nitrospira inopinata]CUQ65442.1 protein of unknown function [Candidatus Nitrospira inopinata]
MKHGKQVGARSGPFRLCGWQSACVIVLLFAGCGTGGDDPEPNSPLTTPMAFVVNQDDTTLTTLRLDGKFSPVIGTLSLGPVQPDAIGGVTFSLGEWVFATHTAGDRVAAIDPIGGSPPILENFITTNPADTTGHLRVGRRPTKIYRDPVDREVLWTTNEGDPDGIDRLAGCTNGGSVSILHNSHLGVGGGEQPRITSRVCLSGKGEFFVVFALPPSQRSVFVASKTTGIVSVLLGLPIAGGGTAWSELPMVIDLCNRQFAMPSTVNCNAAPTGLFWSQATDKAYAYLSGRAPSEIIEINPTENPPVSKSVQVHISGSQSISHVGMAPDGRELLVIIEDRSDSDHVVTRFASVDVTVSGGLTLTDIPAPVLQDVRVAQFQFTPDGRQLYLLASNDSAGLTVAQAANQRKDLLVILNRNPLNVAREVSLPLATSHAMDLWITGPAGAGSARGVVVTNATSGVNGTVSLIDPNSGRITSTFRVGRNPKMVTVYYYGLVRNNNQATPRW